MAVGSSATGSLILKEGGSRCGARGGGRPAGRSHGVVSEASTAHTESSRASSGVLRMGSLRDERCEHLLLFPAGLSSRISLLESAVSAGLLLLPGARPGPRGGGVAAGQVQWNRPGPEDAQDPFVWRPWAKKRRPLRWARRSTARGLTSREMSCWACGGSENWL